jgi:hypothetical protein
MSCRRCSTGNHRPGRRRSLKPRNSGKRLDIETAFQLTRDLIESCVNSRCVIVLTRRCSDRREQRRASRRHPKKAVHITADDAPVCGDGTIDGPVRESEEWTRCASTCSRSNVHFVPREKHAMRAGVTGTSVTRTGRLANSNGLADRSTSLIRDAARTHAQ